MGKSPMVYSGNERSRHHNYSRNNQSRNRRSQNQEIGPANYIYSPDPYLRQFPPGRRGNTGRGNKHVGRGSSQQYYRERSFRKRPNRGYHLRVQQHTTPQRKRQRENMHPPEVEAASDVTEQSTDVTKNETDSTSQSQAGEEVQSNGTTQISALQTRSSAKSQQNKSEDTGPTEKNIKEDGDTKVQSLQTRSTSKARGKSEEPDRDEDSNSKITRSTRGSSNKSLQSKSDNTCVKELFEVEEIIPKDKASTSPTKSVSKVQNKLAESGMHKADDSDKTIHKSRGNKSVSDEKASGMTAEVQSVEEKTGSHNTRSVAKTKQETNDKTEDQGEGENVSKTKKLGHETKTVAVNESVDTKSKPEQDIEVVILAETGKVAHHRSYDHEGHLSKEVTVSVFQEAAQRTDKTGTAEENEMTIEKEVVSVSPKTKKLIGSKSPQLILSHVDTSPEKRETDTLFDQIDVTRRSSRRSSSKAKTEETLFSHRRQLRGHSGTPVQIQPETEHKDHGDTSMASIRSISCRRPIRDSPISSINDSFHKRRTLIVPQVQLSAKTTSEYLSGSRHDVTAEKTHDMSSAFDDSFPPKEKSGKRKVSLSDDTSPPKERPGKRKLSSLDDTSPPKEKPGKRKYSPLETMQEHKKLCTPKTAQSSSFLSDMSSTMQITKQQELVSSSTPLKVVECFDAVHMEVSEENISEESLEFEKTGDITDQSITLESETLLVKENIVDESRVYGKTRDISGQSVAVESETYLAEHSNEQVTRKWCSVM